MQIEFPIAAAAAKLSAVSVSHQMPSIMRIILFVCDTHMFILALVLYACTYEHDTRYALLIIHFFPLPYFVFFFVLFRDLFFHFHVLSCCIFIFLLSQMCANKKMRGPIGTTHPRKRLPAAGKNWCPHWQKSVS